MRRFFISIFLVILLTLPALASPGSNAAAQSVSAGDLISLVNSLRTGNGLPALTESSILDSTAYNTAAQMAANGVCAHIGGARERIAAAGFGSGATIFATENMACGRSADIGWIQSVWSDEVHMWPMTQAKYTHVGAGVYTGSDGTTYYVLHAAYMGEGGSVSSAGTTGGNTVEEPAEAEQLVAPVITSTPQEDGSTYHVVEYGQTLYSIAEWYGVTIEQIQQLNGLTGSNIFVGKSLLIRLAPTATITPTRTSTPRQPTRTPSLSPTATKHVILATPTVTQEPTFTESLPTIDRQWLGFGLLIASAVGLMFVLYFEFIRPKLKK